MSRILGVGKALPANVVTNSMLTSLMDTSDEWIQQRSGIKERHWVRGISGLENGKETSSSLAASAIRKALEQSNLNVRDLDAVFYASITPDTEIPGSVTFLHAELGLRSDCFLVPIRNHCAGFLYGLFCAHSYVSQNENVKNVAVVGVEVQSTGLNLSDVGRDTAVLFGDGAGAFIISRSRESELGIKDLLLKFNGGQADKLGVTAPSFEKSIPISVSDFEGDRPRVFPHMEGKYVFKWATSKMAEVVQEIVERNGFQLSDLAVVVPHQANQRILDVLESGLSLKGRVYSAIERYGNTTAASIPIAFSDALLEGKISRGDLICLVSFGAGFSWGACLLRY